MTWLFTVLACAVDGDFVGTESPQVVQAASDLLHQPGTDSRDDGCCQLQSTAVASFDVAKLPNVTPLITVVSLVFLYMLSLSATALRIDVIPNERPRRRRFEFLVHSLQPQAPPR